MPRKKREPSELAATQDNSKEMSAQNSTGSPSTRTTAKGVKNITAASSESKEKQALVRYIVEKYIIPKEIDWGRDATIGYRLIKKYPERRFWETLPIKRQVPSMAILAAGPAAKKIKFYHEDFIKNLSVMQALTFEEPTKIELSPDKIGEDYKVEKKANSLIDFLK